jgi:ketosteroid isomerase-like protein
MQTKIVAAALAVAMSQGLAAIAVASPEDDRKAVAALDTAFQAAVKVHDVATIDRTLHADMTLILGDGRVVTREDHLQAARDKKIQYEVQDEDPGTQFVRVSGDTAVVTARLRIKGSKEGVAFDRRLWFSDTYVRTPQGWKYFFGQASLPLPDDSPKH